MTYEEWLTHNNQKNLGNIYIPVSKNFSPVATPTFMHENNIYQIGSVAESGLLCSI